MKRLILYIAGVLFLAGCSTTKHLPEGEILYTGQKTMIVENRSTTPVGEIAMEEVEAALATAPNNSLLGSSSIRIPFPMGLWIYNGFVKYENDYQDGWNLFCVDGYPLGWGKYSKGALKNKYLAGWRWQ